MTNKIAVAGNRITSLNGAVEPVMLTAQPTPDNGETEAYRAAVRLGAISGSFGGAGWDDVGEAEYLGYTPGDQ